MLLEMKLKKLEHYTTRYTEHFKSIAFSQKKKIEIQNQVKTCLEMTNKYGPQDFDFLEQISELVISKLFFFICRSEKDSHLYLRFEILLTWQKQASVLRLHVRGTGGKFRKVE